MLHHEAADPEAAEREAEVADSFVIQVGTRFYGPFDSDDAAYSWATPIFDQFNIKPVIAPSSAKEL